MRITCDSSGFTASGKKLGRPRVDHSRLACTRCGKPRDRSASKCKACQTELRREHRHKNPERTRLVARAWLEKNPEKRRKYARQNYERHKERFIKSAKEWAKNNPEKRSRIMAFQNAKRRSRKLANGGAGFSADHWKELLRRCDGVCVYCRKNPSNSVDHFVPLKLGGQDDYRNIVPACMKCNSTKRENEPRSWVIQNYGEERLNQVTRIILQ